MNKNKKIVYTNIKRYLFIQRIKCFLNSVKNVFFEPQTKTASFWKHFIPFYF